ncbi:hypothetical protein QIS74_07973 [Colletotrichum tabaci]|uniref:Uncharacterized protein n=1 Tax=Colletotrichum tabaci TaxID=1209068 RepID=A0AAV9T6F7_9PEZI
MALSDELWRFASEGFYLFVRIFGVLLGLILTILLCAAFEHYATLAIWASVGFLTLGVRHLCEQATQGLRARWLALPDRDIKKPRIPGTWPGMTFLYFSPPSPPDQEVCDPITDSEDSSKHEKKKEKALVAEQKRMINQIKANHAREMAKIHGRHREFLKQYRQSSEYKDKEIESLKKRVGELDFHLNFLETERFHRPQLEPVPTDLCDHNFKTRGRYPTMSVRLPMLDFSLKDVVRRRKAETNSPFNVTIYRMYDTTVLSDGPVSLAQSSPDASKTVEQVIESPIVVPSPVVQPDQPQSSVPSPVSTPPPTLPETPLSPAKSPSAAVAVTDTPLRRHISRQSLERSRLKHLVKRLAQLRASLSARPQAQCSETDLAPTPAELQTHALPNLPIESPFPRRPRALPPRVRRLRARQNVHKAVSETSSSPPSLNSASPPPLDPASIPLPASPIPSKLATHLRPSSPIAAPDSPALSDLPPLPISDLDSEGDDKDDHSDNGGSTVAVKQQQMVKTLPAPLPAQPTTVPSVPASVIASFVISDNQMDVDDETKQKTKEKEEDEGDEMELDDSDRIRMTLVDLDQCQMDLDDSVQVQRGFEMQDVDMEDEPKQDVDMTDELGEDVDMTDELEEAQAPTSRDIDMRDDLIHPTDASDAGGNDEMDLDLEHQTKLRVATLLSGNPSPATTSQTSRHQILVQPGGVTPSTPEPHPKNTKKIRIKFIQRRQDSPSVESKSPQKLIGDTDEDDFNQDEYFVQPRQANPSAEHENSKGSIGDADEYDSDLANPEKAQVSIELVQRRRTIPTVDSERLRKSVTANEEKPDQEAPSTPEPESEKTETKVKIFERQQASPKVEPEILQTMSNGTPSHIQAGNVTPSTPVPKVKQPEGKIIIFRRKPANPMMPQKKTSKSPCVKGLKQQNAKSTLQVGTSPSLSVQAPPNLTSGSPSEGRIRLFQMTALQNTLSLTTVQSLQQPQLFPDRPARKHKFDEVDAVDENWDGDIDLDGPPRKIAPLPARAQKGPSAVDEETRRRLALEAKRRWLLVQEQAAITRLDPVVEHPRGRPPPQVASEGVSSRDDRLLLFESPELRQELLHKLQALWPILPKNEVDRIRLNKLRSWALAEWRKLLNPVGKDKLPANTYISMDSFEREVGKWMQRVVNMMVELNVVPEVNPVLRNWRELVVRQGPRPEPKVKDNK